MSITRYVLPPHGRISLLGSIGTELDIVNAARVSFAKASSALGERDQGLLNFLLRERHGTPFEMGFISQWHVRAPLAVFYEWHRHRIGFSYNEESGRYVELRPDFYIPQREDVRTQVGKPGAYSFQPVDDEELCDLVERSFDEVYFRAYQNYQEMVKRGVAKELARMVLPVGIFKEMRFTCNARSLMHFLSLRADEDAQYEIRAYAQAMERIFADHMPIVHKCWVEHGRMAP